MIRDEPPRNAPERTSLEGWLTYQRQTLAMKCEGLNSQQLCERSVPPSSMSLIGLVRHMAEVERHWFQRFIGGADKTTAGPIYYSEGNPDGDFDDIDSGAVADDLALWRSECDRADEIFAGRDLDETRPSDRDDRVISVRWVMIHMIEEYARHNGHADFLRERIDGATGD